MMILGTENNKLALSVSCARSPAHVLIALLFQDAITQKDLIHLPVRVLVRPRSAANKHAYHFCTVVARFCSSDGAFALGNLDNNAALRNR